MSSLTTLTRRALVGLGLAAVATGAYALLGRKTAWKAPEEPLTLSFKVHAAETAEGASEPL